VLAVGGFVVSQVLKHNRDHDYADPEPTATATDGPPTRGTVPTAPATHTTAPKPTKTTPPPPPPPSDNDIVTKNRLYKTGVQASVGCRESGARANSMANARKYYTQILNCLIKAWPKQVALAGGKFTAPHLIPYSGYVSTPCSGAQNTSFYCSSNQTIYMNAGQDLAYYKQYLGYANRTQAMTWLRAEMTDTVAHEFGHHVQDMTGILDAEDDLAYDSSETKALELSRRLELQATCFGNVFMGANKNSYHITGQFKYQLDWTHSHQGDEYSNRPDHGSRAVYPQWANAGFSTRSPRGCNTFTAPATSVR
jgi:uncharacterized protein